ncbi:hypothetical protein M422DRAFT_38425 [Sphaerobolus stellatus SS14]|uniref:Ubiquitin-like protease family profile domain-containing protein n=1 Tax=Sphaerobolus stellatus (strain SS14) TaxID=990650 RepID=A0A0C9UL60_SPHS4|nr:hypothetical protein M422DRAFT_38425 [Sphaerobolus stellatus SS14]
MDSLGCNRHSTRTQVIEWLRADFAKRNLEGAFPRIHRSVSIKVPQQPNSCDCGLYTIHYIDRFVRNHSKILQALKENDVEALGAKSIWRPDLAKNAREDFAIHVRRFARLYLSSK